MLDFLWRSRCGTVGPAASLQCQDAGSTGLEDLVLLQLWLGSDPWPQNSMCCGAVQKETHRQPISSTVFFSCPTPHPQARSCELELEPQPLPQPLPQPWQHWIRATSATYTNPNPLIEARDQTHILPETALGSQPFEPHWKLQ